MNVLPESVKRPMTTAMARWFAARAPKSDSATLNLRNVYIFFSREGLLFAVLLLGAFEDDVDACHQFTRAEGFGDVIIAADF